MENEIMNYEEVMDTDVELYEAEPEETKSNVGLAVLIGAGLTAATFAAVKLGKWAWTKIKSKKESQMTAEEDDYKDLADDDE